MKISQIIAYFLIVIGFVGVLFATIGVCILFLCGFTGVYYYANFGWLGMFPFAIGLGILK